MMESRPAPLRSRRVCRFCLTENDPLNFIYEREHNKQSHLPLALQIMSCVSIEVYAADGMPQLICNNCRWNLDRSYKFKMQCKKADEALRAYPQSGVLPRPFPPISLEQGIEVGVKRSNDERGLSADVVKKPRVDNGDNKRETRGRPPKITQEIYEDEQDAESENDVEPPVKNTRSSDVRVHACDQCDRTFPLKQALMLHIQRGHRDRNYKCTECERTFFSKYDLQKHMSTHSEEKPYSCGICNKQFTRANLLQRHEKVHRDELRYGCQHCDREFFSTEELEKHEEQVHKSVKPFQCNICNKRFTYKQGLERHEMLHNEDKSFACEYCKEAFRTSNKLARHLTTHAGHRPYLCKLCPRTFLLSHHLTRHMRSHSVEKRHVCEDCGKAFKRKESLEVHQLTHTKRTGMGLTCDVCQESCRNRADYVTHIKQHIEAGEKMGPDGLPPDSSEAKMESETEEDEDEEEEQYSDGDDDYRPPAYVVKKLPKPQRTQRKVSESEEDFEKMEKSDKEEKKVIYVQGKDGNVIKKTLKTLIPMQRGQEKQKITVHKGEEVVSSKRDETEAQVQKIVASVFKEHKLPLKQSAPDVKEEKVQVVTKQEKVESQPGTAKTVKVIKRIIVRKSGGGTETSTTVIKDGEGAAALSSVPTGAKVTKRVIVRRIIRQGDTTREVILNPDGTVIDPSELAKIQAGSGQVVKRVVVKKPVEKSQEATTVTKTEEQPKFELKTSVSGAAKAQQQPTSKEEQEKIARLEMKLEQQRLKIEELQAKKQQEYDPDEMPLPERHDESEDEQQQLPLKRVFVKRKQSIYDEEQEYNDKDEDEEDSAPKATTEVEEKPPVLESQDTETVQENPASKPSSKVYTNKKMSASKTDEGTSDIDAMNQELTSILESTDDTVKMQANVLDNLTEVTNAPQVEETTTNNSSEETEQAPPVEEEKTEKPEEPMEVEESEPVKEQQEKPESEPAAEQNLSESADIFDTSEEQQQQQPEVATNESVIELSQGNDTIQLNDTGDNTRDSIEDKLSQMEG